MSTTEIGIQVTNERGCILVKETETHYVEIAPMLYNFRLVLTPKASPMGYDAGWCYFGVSPETFARCWHAAMAFDPDTQADPEGYNKALQRRTV